MATRRGTRLTGMSEVMSGLQREIEQIEGVTHKGLLRAALLIRRHAQELTPVVTGNLRDSCYVWTSWAGVKAGGQRTSATMATQQHALEYREGRPVVVVGYSAVYAASVHENPRAGKTGGVSPSGRQYQRTKTGRPTWSTRPQGQWKFLEQAVQGNKNEIIRIIQQEARRK
jgi:hypothetical protein